MTTVKYKVEIATSHGKRSVMFTPDEKPFEEVKEKCIELIFNFRDGEGDPIREFFGIDDDDTYIRSEPKFYVIKTEQIKINV